MAINVTLQGNIIEHLVSMRLMDQEAKRHFHFKSKLWRAIQEHIHSNDCVLFVRKGTVAIYSAGPGIALEDAYVPIHFPDQPQMLALKIRVSYWSDEDFSRQDTTDQRHHISVPANLEANFTQKAFDLWLEQKRKERDSDQEKTDIAALDRLLKKYPLQAATLMQQVPVKSRSKSKTLRSVKSKRSSRTKTAR